MVGAVLVLVTLFVVGPIGVFFSGALWSALMGWLLVDEADRRAEQPAAQS